MTRTNVATVSSLLFFLFLSFPTKPAYVSVSVYELHKATFPRLIPYNTGGQSGHGDTNAFISFHITTHHIAATYSSLFTNYIRDSNTFYLQLITQTFSQWLLVHRHLTYANVYIYLKKKQMRRVNWFIPKPLTVLVTRERERGKRQSKMKVIFLPF